MSRRQRMFTCTAVGLIVTCVASCVSLLPAQTVAADAEPAIGLNLAVNGGFEHDWYNTRSEVMGCPLQPRVTFGQADSVPDGWQLGECQRVAEAHAGLYGMRIPAGASVKQDGMGYAIQVRAPLKAVPVRFSAWVKGTGPQARLDAEVALSGLNLKKSQEFPCPAEWTRVAFDIPADEVQNALDAQAQPAGAINASVTLKAVGEPVVIDEVVLERPYTPAPYSLAPNAGFETVGAGGAPDGWKPVQKALRYAGTWYYVWRSWYHFMSVPRGTSAVDGLMAVTGKRSFRMNVPPGDEKYIETETLLLNQPGPQAMALRLDYNAYMLDGMIVQVMDEQGREVFAEFVQAGTTGGWHAYQRVFTPRPISPRAILGTAGPAQPEGEPVALKSCTVRIGVRGVNGSNHDDINQWVNVNHAGVLWIDNVALMELETAPEDIAARGAAVHGIPEDAPGLLVESIDLGERLYGENTASVTILNLGPAQARGTVTMAISGPHREDDPLKAGYAVGALEQDPAQQPPRSVGEQEVTARFEAPPGGRMTLALPYRMGLLLEDWRSEYRVVLFLNPERPTRMTFGTWSQQVLVEVERCYAFPDYTEQTVSLNLGVARKTLEGAGTLQMEVRRARDDAVVTSRVVDRFPDLVAGFNLSQLPQPLPDQRGPGMQGDATNFYQCSLDISNLTIHLQTEPVRDHYVYVCGVDAGGDVLFEGRSPRFGRMERHAEKLDPIQKVEISEDNYLLVNGKPFFIRGHIQMQQVFGPSIFAHQLIEDWKAHGFNTSTEGRRHDPAESWAQNLYQISQNIQAAPPMTEEVRGDIRQQAAHAAVLGVNYIAWEGAPEGGTDTERVLYAREIKSLANGRPLWISAGWFSPTVNGVVYPDYLDHDLFMPENESYFGPSQLDRELAPKKRARGERYVLGTYPNVFNDMPWNVQRFELYTDVIRGHTGFQIIGIPGDKTLQAGLNGEVRFIESFLFSKQPTPTVEVSPGLPHIVRTSDGKTYILATNAGPAIGGDWRWNRQVRDRGVASHTGDALWNRFHGFMKDYHSHYYKDAQPVAVRKGDEIVQYVFVPADADVECLILMARGNGDWMYHAVWGNFDHQAFTDSGVRMWMGKDMNQMFWGTVGFCGPEGSDPRNPNLLKHVFTQDQFHRVGDLPAKGVMARLQVPVEALGLDGKLVDGFGFVSKGANVWWERTLLVRDGKETVLCDGSVGVPPEQLKMVRFQVEGLRAGTKVKACFEERDVVAQDGYFEDDLSGEPGYQNIWVGIYGDKLGETGYYGDGVFYNYNWGKVAARLYEIELGGR